MTGFLGYRPVLSWGRPDRRADAHHSPAETTRSEHGLTIVLITHDTEIAQRAGRLPRMLDGRIIEDRPAAGVPAVATTA